MDGDLNYLIILVGTATLLASIIAVATLILASQRREIATRKKAENVLRESEEKYRLLVESIDDAVYLIDRNKRYLYANKKYLSRLGISLDELGGLEYEKFHSLEATTVFGHKIDQVIASGQPIVYEHRSHRDNRYFLRTLSSILDPIVEGVEVITVSSKDITERKQAEEEIRKHRDHLEKMVAKRTDELLITNDRLQQEITERKQAEELLEESERRYRQIVEEASDIVFTTDAQGYFNYVNPPTKKFTGYSEEELIGMHFKNLIPVKSRNRVQLFLLKQLRERIRKTTLEFPITTRAGDEKWIEQKVTFLRDGDQVARFQGIVRDITERKQAEAALQKVHDQLERRVKKRTAALIKVNKQLEKDITRRKRAEQEVIEISEKEQRRIAQDLHDDLGQQLIGMAYMFEVLSDKYSAGKTIKTEDFTKIEAVVVEVIERLHTIAKNLTPISVEGGDLSHTLQKLAESVQDNYGIRCIFEQLGETTECERDIATNIYRIAQEAANNAVRHGRPSQILIRLETRGDEIVLLVRDNGTGISDQELISGGMGLKNMEFRADLIGAKLNIGRDQNGGTIVSCSFENKLALKS